MKTSLYYVLLSLCTLTACNQPEKTTSTGSSETKDSLITAETATAPEQEPSMAFDISQIPISSHDLGVFPYLAAPEGYGYGNYGKGMKPSDIVDFDKEYFAVNGKLIPQEGKSCKVAIDVLNSSTTTFNKLLLEKSFEKAILDLGGVQVNNVEVPKSEVDRIGNKELLDNNYGFSIGFNSLADIKTYVIRTKEKELWIQFYFENKESGRITFLEKQPMETLEIKKITADQLKADIDASGKAVVHINFDSNKASIKADGIALVQEIAALLKANPAMKLSIEGHTDDRGDKQKNKQLSLDRANAVQSYLLSAGIPQGNLKAKGLGAEMPLAKNDSEDNKAINRRVELVKF